MFLCIPILFGCQTKIQPKKEQISPRVRCPVCHNASVLAAKSTTWFELFWIPLVPISKKHVWICEICRWQQKEPPTNNNASAGAWVTPAQPGYHPAYIN